MLRERILVGGVPGTGKTYAWLTIARNNPDSMFYVIDPDDSVRRVWFSEFPEVKNVEYYFTPKWYYDGMAKVPSMRPIKGDPNCFMSGVADAWRTIKPKLKQGDWIIVEHMHLIWNAVIDSFADEVFNKEIGQYFLEARKNTPDNVRRLDALKGWTDWNVINKLHNDDFIIPVCFENEAHVFMTTSVSINNSDTEAADLKAFYGDTKLRYDGQKHTPYRSQTMMMFKQSGSGQNRRYIMSTFQKDRGREWLEDVEWGDFFFEYLVAVAGWE